MMKNQLAGLMKQAQQMQDNLQEGAGGSRPDRGRRPGRRGPGEGADDLPPRREAGDDRSVAARRGPRHAGGPDRRGGQRRRAPGRSGDAGEDVRADDGHADAARAQAAVLSIAGRPPAMDHRRDPRTAPTREPLSGLEQLARALRCLPGRRAEGRAADGAAPAAARPRRRGAPRARARARGADGPPLRALQHVHRGCDLRAVPVREARREPAVRRRDPGRPADGRADATPTPGCTSC